MRTTRIGLTVAAMLMAGSAAQAQVSDDAVKIGVLTDHSGGFAYLVGKHSVEAAQMAVDDFGGKVLGKPISVVTADHQNKADIASAISRKWFETEGVDTITDVAGSAVALATQEIARSRGKVLLISGAATTELTGKACSETTSQWSYDTYAFAKGTASQVTKQGGDSWYFLTSDYAFGHSLQRDASRFVEASGGKVLGSVRFPFGSPDFSSFLLQAQSSKAKIIGLANAGGDTTNAVKQAAEFGIVQGGQKLASLLLFITDVHSLGLKVANGLQLTESFYWDTNDGTRNFSKRFAARMKNGAMPSMVQAGDYASTLHYLKALEALGGNPHDGMKAVAKMKELPTDDPLFGKGVVRADGRKIHPAYLFEVKKPEESKGPWDYYKLVTTIPAEEAFRPLSESDCPLVKK